jgi:hypothetical protein
MKNLIKLFLIVTTLIIGYSILKLIDISTSFKYEVEQPLAMSKSNDFVIDKSHYLTQFMFWLCFFIFYCGLSFVFVVYIYLKLKYNNQNKLESSD